MNDLDITSLDSTLSDFDNAERYRKLKALGACNSKSGGGFSPGSRDKAFVQFRYWCSPEELDKMIDEA